MKNISKEFGVFLDSLRDSRHISKEDFVEGIMSTRQYHRYIKGEASISNANLLSLIDKLEMNFINVYGLFSNIDDNEIKLVRKIYNKIINSDFKTAYIMINDLDSSSLTTKYSKSFLMHCKITSQLNLSIISEEMAMREYKELIDFPNCLDYETINFVELISLISISNYQYKKENDKSVIYFLYNILKDMKLLFNGETNNRIPSLIATTCQSLGILGEHKKVLNLSNKGIAICQKANISNSLVHLFYYKSLALYYSGKKKEALIPARKVFLLLEVENNSEKTNEFEKLLKKHFGIKKEVLLIPMQ